MAVLTLKVSESLYIQTINELKDKADHLKIELDALQNKRQQLERLYKGPTALLAIRTLKNDEDNAARAIRVVLTQRLEILKYLNSLNTADKTISDAYNAAKKDAESVFG